MQYRFNQFSGSDNKAYSCNLTQSLSKLYEIPFASSDNIFKKASMASTLQAPLQSHRISKLCHAYTKKRTHSSRTVDGRYMHQLHVHLHLSSTEKTAPQLHSPRLNELLNAVVFLRIFIYNGAKMKLGSVCRADQAQSNCSTIRSLANFHIELEQFCCSLTAA